MQVTRSGHIMPASLSICGAIAGAMLLVAPAGCGGSDDSQPPLLITQTNAQAVAAEALVATAQTTTGVQQPRGSIVVAVPAAAVPAALTQAMRGADRRAVERVVARRSRPGPAAADTMTEACAAGGTITTNSTDTSATVTFANCRQDANSTMNGSLKYTIKTSSGSTELSLSVSIDLTITVASVSFAESGGYDLTFKSSSGDNSSFEFELSGSRLSVSVSKGGTLSDKATLSDFDIDVKQDLSSTPSEVIETVDYDVDSTRLKGHISVMTNDPIKQIADDTAPHQYPHAGQVLVTGASKSRLQITILGDETFTAPAGQGQVKIELDTGSGSFGAAIYANWSDLQVLAGATP